MNHITFSPVHAIVNSMIYHHTTITHDPIRGCYHVAISGVHMTFDIKHGNTLIADISRRGYTACDFLGREGHDLERLIAVAALIANYFEGTYCVQLYCNGGIASIVPSSYGLEPYKVHFRTKNTPAHRPEPARVQRTNVSCDIPPIEVSMDKESAKVVLKTVAIVSVATFAVSVIAALCSRD